MLVTKEGMRLNALFVDTGLTLVFTRMVAGTGTAPSGDLADMAALQAEYADLQGIAYSPPAVDPSGNGFSFSVIGHMDNTNLLSEVRITEVGIFCKDESGNEVLYGIDPRYDAPVIVYPPNILPGFVSNGEAVFVEYVEIHRDLQINLTLIATGNLTMEAADGRYWIIGVKYPATEITESVGFNTEEWQRIQDDRIDQILQLLQSGSTAGIIYERPTLMADPLNWNIRNFSGWRNPVTGAIEA